MDEWENFRLDCSAHGTIVLIAGVPVLTESILKQIKVSFLVLWL